MDHVGIRRASLIAGSAASGEALDFAISYPDRVAALVLVGPTARGLIFSDHFLARTPRQLGTADEGRADSG